ncbi:nucleotide-binding domain-containing protein [Rhizoclosmatium globosum]|uniref:Nucleotide-binding domain-containing protein n=1 Tax=Rhizoclosmatium globosum TaxID=329046 RepID=A0A1Y2C2S8_9FUNG|nr:nucleotide-binding domain-containing protein [Rhizoclosmatium globosum]|eukprot:ORY41353.1 nucleotide-binding domain-containing protein [Rhizoclosmatium globosum]
MEQQRVAVLGSGVQGLTTALLLLHQGVKKVVVVANAGPGAFDKKDSCFASPKAGANWQTFAGNDDQRLQEYDEVWLPLDSFGVVFLSFLPQCGIMRLPGFMFYDEKPVDFQHPWYARFVKNYAYATATDLPPNKKFGVKYETITMNVPKYLAWLVNRVKAKGGSLKLGGVEDSSLYPVRGQTILVRAPQVQRTIGTALPVGGTRGVVGGGRSSIYLLIPREDGIVILGGTYQKGKGTVFHGHRCRYCSSIMERCVAVCPELVQNGKFPEIVEHSVGLRPARYGDCRLDSQNFHWQDILFINNYGHGGYGYQSSWGCAQSVVRMVRRAVGTTVDDKILTKLLKETITPETRDAKL